MPLEQEIDDDAKQMANQSQRGTWWASGCCWKVAKAVKALPCCTMNAHICSCMFLGIMWKIYVGFVADIDIKILGVPPLGLGMPFLDNDTCAGVGGYLFLLGFFSLYDVTMDGWRDGWMDESREKASRKTTTKSFTICNNNDNFNSSSSLYWVLHLVLSFVGSFPFVDLPLEIDWMT